MSVEFLIPPDEETPRAWSNSRTREHGLHTLRLGSMEISLAPEIRAGIGRIGFRQAREAFRDTVGGILADPFGPTSIDEFKDTDAGRTARLVHRVVHPMLADIVPGKKLALKWRGLDMDFANRHLWYRRGIPEQFAMTRGLTTRPEYAGLRAMGIEIVEVYGCAAYVESDGTRREWMIMEEIADAEAIENKWLAMARPRGGASRRAGFSVASYPELADFVKKTRPYRYGEHVTVISFSDLAQAIEDTLGISKYAGHFKDLNGNNVLVQTRPDGTRRYMLIDIGSSL